MSVYAGPADWWTDGTDAGRTHIATKGIVQSGLVLNLDAGASSSYPGTGTTWTDLSGTGNNGTLTNGPTFNSSNGGYINFDGVDDTINCGTATQIGSTLTGLTVSAWVYPTASATKMIAENGTTFTTNTFYLAQENTTNFSFAIYGTGQDFIQTGFTYQLNTWYNLVGVWTPSSRISFYSNMLDVSIAGLRTGSAQTSLINGNTNLFLGSRAGTSLYFAGRIPLFSAYNRALSAAEILQNFNALRGRFGI